jgi:hypothetical protein
MRPQTCKRILAFAIAAATAACGHEVAPIVRPLPVQPAAAPAPPKPVLLVAADVDARLIAEWSRAGVSPSAPADDATWLRRAWLDVLGTIPPPEVTLRFLAETDTAKRDRMIENLLASPLWPDHWTRYFDAIWMGRSVREADVDRGAFRSWLHDAFARNAPWSDVATQLLTATGQNSDGGPKKASEQNDGTGSNPAGVNGAVNWTLRFVQTPQDMAGVASRTLLGVQIQCAQCHDHKTESWKQKDFQSFAAAFVRTRPVPIDIGPPMGAIRRVELRDLDRPAPRFAKMGDIAPILKLEPKALDGTSLDGPDGARQALARWMTSPQNHWFSRAFVNRMWGHFLGRGFVDPVDDFRESNPANAPSLLDALASDFIASGYDIKHLVRLIVGSAAYARSSAPLDDVTARADPEAKLWERFHMAPLGPDDLLEALIVATKLDAIVRASGRLDLPQVRFRVGQRYGFLFDVDEESDEAEYDGTIAQSLTLLNGSVSTTGASVLPGSALGDIVGSPGDDADKIRAIYVRALTRPPTRAEIDRWTRYLADAPTPPPPPAPPLPAPDPAASRRPAKSRNIQQPDPLRSLEGRAGNERASARVHAYEDLLWTLLNSSEFVLNH